MIILTLHAGMIILNIALFNSLRFTDLSKLAQTYPTNLKRSA
ncbi:hypothetical protein EV690_1810 [Celerinatantimonas diazotrophica]|uniref:Uncharacterized protein n=1 Tax=Celerinatantimonas diazotrophica TaxID=412034 RepID=A0A4R1K293_9GAMM|nr:hypothetical protein EV690_1810 [Celerinatantimonas diazotrophica]CAG9297826.1 hypothetical protein CEDIAZO_03017 [Celerinatantimonas diazotrophica]